MPLPAGTRLGPYEIADLLGQGGMGQVYRARDTRLDRVVAVKVLPPELAADPQFRERFDREARAISALNHPNICTLYDVGKAETTSGVVSGQTGNRSFPETTPEVVSYLVMEYLEGETLAARLERGPIGLSDALKIAIEMASALDKAHRQDIVHRDLKPGNVMLTKSGAKLLDFGLARTGGAAAIAPAASVQTMSQPLTARGTILGTLQYMAPEQVEGEDADARTDVFAFGAMLFEMLTGRRAFLGKSQASLLGAILKDDPPPVSQVQPVSPAALDHVVRTCLAKDPDDRFQTARDVAIQLQWIQSGASAVVPAPSVPARTSRARLPWIAFGVMAAIAVALGVPGVRHLTESAPDLPRVTFTIDASDAGPIAPGSVSPDGRWIVLVMSGPGNRPPRIWLRSLASPALTPIDGTENPGMAFWSADARSIGFSSGGQLKRVAVDGHAITTIGPLPSLGLGGGTLAPDGSVVVSAERTLYHVAVGSGTTVLYKPDPATHLGFYGPRMLPNGRDFLLYATSTSPERTGIYLGSLDSTALVFVQRSESTPIFAPPDALLYVRDGALVMRRFDPGSRQVSGEPVQLAGSVSVVRASGRVMASASERVLAFQAGWQPEGEVVWISRDGKPLGVIGEPGAFNGPQISPDQTLVAVARADQQTGLSDVWTIDLGTGVMSRLTYEPAVAGDRVWSPDGQSMAFWTRRKGKTDFYQQTLGTREATLLYESPEDSKWLDDWGPGFLLFHRDNAVYRVPLTGERTPQRLIQSPAAVDQVKVSKDGRYLAYGSVASGRWEVYVAPIAAPDRHRQVSAVGGGQPRWRKDGRELYYITADGVMMAVEITPSAAPDAPPGVSAPKRLFQSPLERTTMTSDHYDVSSDGSKFIFIRPLADAERPSVTVVVNWK